MTRYLISCRQPVRGGGFVERLGIALGHITFTNETVVLVEMCHNGRQLGVLPQTITWAIPLVDTPAEVSHG